MAASNRDLQKRVKEGKFRQDLLFRLNVFPIEIPPLRERQYDIPALAHQLIIKKAKEIGLPDIPHAEDHAIDRLLDYDWPGNVRELENVIEREIILHPEGPLPFTGFKPSENCSPQEDDSIHSLRWMTLDQVNIKYISTVLKKTGGQIEGPDGAAELLGVNPYTLRARMKKLGIPFGRQAKELYKP